MDILKDFFEMMTETAMDWPLGTIMAILLALLLIMLIGIICIGLYIAVDSWFLPRQQSKGRVICKKFTPAHTQTIMIYNAALKMSLPSQVFHPDDWSLCIEVDGKQDTISVQHKFYLATKEGSVVDTEYVIGRMSGDLYIKGVSK